MKPSSLEAGIYKHYKGGLYEVIFSAKHTETLEDFVVYQALYDTENSPSKFWVRPLKMFLEEVEIEGRLVPRFSKQH